MGFSVSAVVRRVDTWQQARPWFAFPYAVIKKYGDDNGGYQAALLTYYGFLSLFPLLLVLLTAVHWWFGNNPDVQQEVNKQLSLYFPLLGNELQSNVEGMRQTGVGLAIGLLITIYGARGGADALRNMADTAWMVPRVRRTGFPLAILKSIAILACAALGFAATVAASSLTSFLDKGIILTILVNIVGIVLTSVFLALVFKQAVSKGPSLLAMLPGALFAGIGIQILLTFGTMLVAAQLKNLDSLYGTFAIVLGLLFWIYLLAQIIAYGMEINVVRHLKLWPRSIDAAQETSADRSAYKHYARIQKYSHDQEIEVQFKPRKKD